MSVIHGLPRARWLPALSQETKKKIKLKLHLYHIRLPQGSPRDQAWRLCNSSASSMTPGIARGCPSDLPQQHEHLERDADRHWQTDCQHNVLQGSPSAWEEVGHTGCKSTAFLASSCNHCTHTYVILKTSISNVYRSVSFCLLYRNHVCIRDQSWEDWLWMVLYVCNWDAWDREELGL